MMFPGQGSQHVGMARDLAVSRGAAAEFLGSVNDALGFDLLGLMCDGPADALTETRNAQPALLAHSVAVFLALAERGFRPSIVAGHSLGEYSAAVACGALQPLDALRAVRRRGELMFRAGQARPGTMAAVMGLDAERVRQICAETDGVVVLANLNSALQMVISGETAAVAGAADALKSAGARRVIPLKVSGAFHSPLLEDAATEFRAFLADIPVADPVVPLVANVSARPVTDAAALRRGLEDQLTSPVLWHPSLEVLLADAGEADLVLEVGPGKVLTNLAKRSHPGAAYTAVATVEDLDALAAAGRKMEGRA